MQESGRDKLLKVAGKIDKKSWSSWRKSNYEFFNEKLSTHDSKATLVDLGAGYVPFRDLFFRFKYTGVDCVKFPDVSVVADFAKKLPLDDNSADIITMSNTLEHVSNSRLLLEESLRVLKGGGIFIGTMPFLMQAHQIPFDFNRFTYFQLKKILEEVGFTQAEVVPFGNLIDVYNSMELNFFHHIKESNCLPLLVKVLHLWRRGGMRFLRMIFRNVGANEKYAEGYGFVGRK